MASYNVNYDDKRFTEVKTEENKAIKESDKLYDGMINSSDKYYQKQIDATEQWGNTQKQLQQAQTDFTIEQIEQQKAQAEKDYLKEQTGAYTDWQKQKDDYGTNAEKMASSGLAHTGYSESSQVAMFNQYQTRVAMAKESFNKAVLSYNNAMKEARLQNSSVLAELAYQTLRQSLELSLQGFQYKNQFLLEKANAKRGIKDTYYGRFQDIVAQINHENSVAEQIRQYNESLAEEKRQFGILHGGSSSSSSSGRRGSGSGGGTGGGYTLVQDETKAKETEEKKSSQLTVDKQSITALGYGQISASTLNSLVAKGEVIEYEENGKLKYKKSPVFNSTKNSKNVTNSLNTLLKIWK